MSPKSKYLKKEKKERKEKKRRYIKARNFSKKDRDERTRLVREGRKRCERTKHANRHTAGGQGWFSVVVVRADVVPQVRGATGNPECGGTEEARAE